MKITKINKKSLFVPLMVAFLVSFLFVGVFTPRVEGQTTVHVGTESELRAAVSNAANGVRVDITLDKEIGLTGSSLIIPANKDITLRSNGNTEFELFGTSGANTIMVENQGVLTLAGITVTHASGATGGGVGVGSGGRLTMTSGKISGNSGNGVSNQGNFTLSGGTISNNSDGVVIASISFDSISNFTMTGGEIANNTHGVGLSDRISNFNMTNGKIAGNTDYGVYNYVGSFTMSGGEISNNGRGVINIGTFIMTNGKIFSNTISNSYSSIGIYNAGGGGVYNSGTFTMSGGEISNNEATIYNNNNGGGVFTSGTFTMTGGEISKNTATNGGGVFVSNGVFNLYGGKITGNTATRNGGGCWVTDSVTNFNRLVVHDGVVFSDNRALAAYNRASEHDSIYRAYIGDNVKWSEPFMQGYNNFDISYVFGTSITAFTVTVNDGYGTPTGAGSYSVGQTVTLNAGTRAGYNFAGWTVNEGGVTLSSTTSMTATFTMPTSNVVITARWTIIQYNIRYTLNSGTNAAGNPATYNAGNSFPITIGNPTRTSYEFRGWNVTYANGTQASFQTSYSIPAGTIGDITLEANWAAISTDNPGGGGGGSGGGGSGSDSSSSGGGSGSSNNSGNSNNNTPHNDNNNPSDSNDNEQRTNVNEFSIFSIARLIGAAIIALCLARLIITSLKKHFEKRNKRKAAEINSNKLDEPSERKDMPVSWFAVSIMKLNIISKRISENDASRRKFSVTDMTAYIILWLFPLLFIFVSVFLLNPAVYTAIFNLDFAAFITKLGEGLSELDLTMIYLAAVGLWAGGMTYLLIMLKRTYNGIMNTRNGIHELILYYANYPPASSYIYRLATMSGVYSRPIMFELAGSFSSGDKIDNDALTLLIECHNEAVRQSGEYQRQEEQDFTDDEYTENGYAENLDDSVEAYLFEILGVPKTASESEVKDAYRELSKKWHPDTYPTDDPRVKEMASEKFDTIKKAYEQIKQLRGWQ